MCRKHGLTNSGFKSHLAQRVKSLNSGILYYLWWNVNDTVQDVDKEVNKLRYSRVFMYSYNIEYVTGVVFGHT